MMLQIIFKIIIQLKIRSVNSIRTLLNLANLISSSNFVTDPFLKSRRLFRIHDIDLVSELRFLLCHNLLGILSKSGHH